MCGLHGDSRFLALGMIGLATLGGAPSRGRASRIAIRPGRAGTGVGPKVVVDRPKRNLGTIESLDDFADLRVSQRGRCPAYARPRTEHLQVHDNQPAAGADSAGWEGRGPRGL